jgi:hypothetical protein
VGKNFPPGPIASRSGAICQLAHQAVDAGRDGVKLDAATWATRLVGVGGLATADPCYGELARRDVQRERNKPAWHHGTGHLHLPDIYIAASCSNSVRQGRHRRLAHGEGERADPRDHERDLQPFRGGCGLELLDGFLTAMSAKSPWWGGPRLMPSGAA